MVLGISFCIPTYNRLNYLKDVIGFIRSGIGDVSYEIIVCDGGSTDGSVGFLESQEDVVYIKQEELNGSIPAFNLCFEKVSMDYVFWLSDDFVFDVDDIVRCCRVMERYPHVGMVSPVFHEKKKDMFPNVGSLNFKLVLSKTHVFRSSVLRLIGFFDESYRTYFIDVDSHLSVLSLGFSSCFLKGSSVVHLRLEDDTRKSNRDGLEKEFVYYKSKWTSLDSKLGVGLFSRFRIFIFWSFCDRMRFNKIFGFYMKRGNVVVRGFFDWCLNRCVVFKDKNISKDKEIILAQKLPSNVLSSMAFNIWTGNKFFWEEC